MDAKAEGTTATIGGWLPVRDARGGIGKRNSPWFFVALNEEVAPWACERDRQPFWVVASLEALAALVAVITLTPSSAAAPSRGTVLLPLMTDNRGNSFALARLMTTKYPLCLLVMELAANLEARGLLLEAGWAPREWNVEADALTNGNCDGFDPARRVHFDMPSHRWLVFSDLLAVGRKFRRPAPPPAGWPGTLRGRAAGGRQIR